MQDTDLAPTACQAGRLASWLRLEHTDGVGPGTAKRLLAHFGNVQALFAASHQDLCGVVPAGVARALCAPPDAAFAARLEATLAWQAEPGNVLLTQDHPAYPALLRQIHAPPVLLYAKGRIALLSGPALAIVGSRNASAQGAANAAGFAEALSGAGLTIVSGMALGIDAAAHEGALRGAAKTVAVIGTGADRIYPRRNEDLAHRIAAEGCIISEYPLGMGALAANFPRRNRLISGLCCAVLVVEAAARSGSLITAHDAAEQGREVFAIPGSIHAPLSKGCHKLIREGATLVESATELLLALRHAPLGPGADWPHAAAPACTRLLAALEPGALHADTLAGQLGYPPAQLMAELLALELAGHIERLPGGVVQRRVMDQEPVGLGPDRLLAKRAGLVPERT